MVYFRQLQEGLQWVAQQSGVQDEQLQARCTEMMNIMGQQMQWYEARQNDAQQAQTAQLQQVLQQHGQLAAEITNLRQQLLAQQQQEPANDRAERERISAKQQAIYDKLAKQTALIRFDGAPANFANFRRKLADEFEIQGLVLDRLKIHHTEKLLPANLQTWVGFIRDREDCPMGWEDFMERLHTEVFKDGHELRTMQQWHKLSQVGTLADYEKEFYAILHQLPNVSDNEAKNVFIRGLATALQAKVIARRPQKLKEAIQEKRKTAQAQEKLQQRPKESGPTVFTGSKQYNIH